MTTGNIGRLGNPDGSSTATSAALANSVDPATPQHQESIHVLNNTSGIVGVVTLPQKSLAPAEHRIISDSLKDVP